MKLTDLFVKRPVLAIVVNLVILIAGLQSIRSLSVRQYPRSDIAVVTVTTAYVGANADLVRGFITTPLERVIASADGIDYMESSSELRSKITHPLIALLSFIKTGWLVFRTPRAFFRSYASAKPPLSDLAFPLAGLWRRISDKPQRVMRPFKTLATAMGLVAAIAGLEDWAWRVTGFSERVFGASKAEMMERARNGTMAFYEKQYGQSLTIIDTAHLTGLGLLDAPAHEILKLLQYMYFPLVVSLFLIGRSIKRPLVVHHYVYAVGTSVGITFVLNIAGLVVFMLLQGTSPEAALALSGVPELIGLVTTGYLMVILPIVVLPDILPVSRARVMVATLVGGAIWMAGNYFFAQVMVFKLGIVWT